MKKLLLFLFCLISIFTAAQPASIAGKLIPDSCRLLPGQSVGDFLLKKYRQKPNLYFNRLTSNVDDIKKQFPEEVKLSIEVADQVRNRYFLFRYDWDMEKTNVPYQFKKAINWQAIPFGDEEWCFMLNRHKYWIDLGRAYVLTGNEIYARTWVNQVTDWINRNPLHDKSLKKLTWRRIEAGIRCENWIKTFEYVKNARAVTPAFMELFLASLYEHAEYLNSSFSGFSLTSNWGVLEFQGLFNAALFMPECKDAAQWRDDAVARLTECANVQVMHDGTQWEQSPMYHNEVLHCYLNVIYLAEKFNVKLPRIVVEKTRELAWANVKWQKPDYHQPLIGDSDDTDLRGLLTMAALVFNDSGIKSRAFKSLDYETCFITTKEIREKYNLLSGNEPDFRSVYLPCSGDMIMRSGWDENAHYMNLRLKRIGDGHAHDDIFHFALFAHGRDYLVDGGRYTYVDSPVRERLKSSEGHNVLTVDGQPNSIYSDSWSNSYNAYSEGVYTVINDDYDYAEAINTAYKRLPDPVYMKRRILYLKPGLWLLFDACYANGKHQYTQYFNFPDRLVSLTENQAKTTYEKHNLTVKAINPVKGRLTDTSWSPEYNLLRDNVRLEFSKETTGFDSFITALYFPDRGNVTVEKIPVFNRNDVAYSDKVVEALRVQYNDKEYIVLVAHQLDANVTPFYKVDNHFVSGEVVLMQKNGNEYQVRCLKK